MKCHEIRYSFASYGPDSNAVPVKGDRAMRRQSIKQGYKKVGSHFRVSTLITCLTLLLMNTGPAWAMGKEVCDPGEPGCVESPEPKAEWNGPAPTLLYRLSNRSLLWASAWRSQDDPSKPWAKDTYDPKYVNPTQFTAVFPDQCQSEEDFLYWNNDDDSVSLDSLNTYRWSVDGKIQQAKGCALTSLKFQGQGFHDVKLEVYKPGSITPFVTREKTIRIRDRLVVLFGDSASSGEGSPDHQRTGDNEYGVWIDRRCHRSAKAGVPLAVQKMEQEDPHTSITFLNFACSGATLSLQEAGTGAGIIAPYAGIEPPENATEDGTPENYSYEKRFLPSQINQLFYALNCPNGTGGDVGTAGGEECNYSVPNPSRKVDMLFMTGGINDVKFATLMLDCVLRDNCHFTKSPFYNYPDEYSGDVDFEFKSLTEQIPDRYVSFKDIMDYHKIQVDQTYVLEYPDAFTDENGNICADVAEDVLPQSSVTELLYNPIVTPFIPLGASLVPFLSQKLGVDSGDIYGILSAALFGHLKVTGQEVEWMHDVGTPTLNDAVATGVEDVNLNFPGANFHYVSGIADKFFKHGYCSSSNWIRRGTESSERQGPWYFVSKPLNLPDPYWPGIPPYGLGIQAETKGLMHPTDVGYKAIADVLKPIVKQMSNLGPTAKNDIYGTANGETLITGLYNSVLFNDNDPNGDELRAILIEGEGQLHGKFTLSFSGNLTYTPDADFTDGIDYAYYYVTDGAEKSAKAKITVFVGDWKFSPQQVPRRWDWDYPEGEETSSVEIGGFVEFPVCNHCGDRVLRVNPELTPAYGLVDFVKVEDRWIGLYVQNGAIPPLLPYVDKISVQIGSGDLNAFQEEGRAEIDMIINDAHSEDWTWVFQTPEIVTVSGPTTFDVCNGCSELVVNVDVAPAYGTVQLEADQSRGVWVATYTRNTEDTNIPTSDVFSVQIGEQSADGEFRSLGDSRISLAFDLGR